MSNYTIIVSDNIIIKDGLSAELQPSSISTALSAHYSNFSSTVAVVQYYGDRGEYEIEYDHHPMDPKPNNTIHLNSELYGLVDALDSLFTTNYVAP